MKFIERCHPLIIFEYNALSRKYYHLKDVQDVLGCSYLIKRLTEQGSLDTNYDQSWNCVAISTDSPFAAVLGGKMGSKLYRLSENVAGK